LLPDKASADTLARKATVSALALSIGGYLALLLDS
jgi:hypothetical protein